MKKIITIICDVDVPTIHLLNNENYEIHQENNNEEFFTMVKKDSERDDTLKNKT